ncbi:hypothetical protein ACIRBZ_00960 [Streptomyces sp. NPDC094038]|uniref:hypothetical protein n=1 Tax=Streptomyces sp. NPDC094038 TaxID=3366055 RepID=UPI00380749F3
MGTTAPRLVDTARADPWITAQQYRELMISIRYPARDTGGHPRAPQMLLGEAAGFAADGLDRPFLLIGKDGNDLSTVPSCNALWRHSRGPREGLTLCGAEHATFTDEEAMIPQIARRLGLPRETVEPNPGTLAPARAIPAERLCLASFSDRRLRGRKAAGPPAPTPPEVRPFRR